MRAVRFRLAAPALGVFRVRFYRQRLKNDRERNAGPLRECGAPPTGRTKYVEYRGAGRPAPHLYATPGGVRDFSPLTAGSSPACRTSGQGIHGGRPSHDLPARLPTPRQKKPIPFRFPGLRKSRESCISIGSFFLSNTDPLCWALCSYGTRNAVRRQASGLTPREPPPTSHTPAHTSAAPGSARAFFCLVFPDAGVELRLLIVHAPGRRMEHRPARV